MRLIVAAALMLTSLAAAGAEAALPAPLSAHAGKVVYLDFWASWCQPCGQAFPWLNQMQAKYGPDLVVVGVNVDTDNAAAEKFLRKHPASFEILKDPAGALPELYKIDGMPSSVLLDGSGRVLHQHSGFREQQTAEYEAAIRAALPRREASK